MSRAPVVFSRTNSEPPETRILAPADYERFLRFLLAAPGMHAVALGVVHSALWHGAPQAGPIVGAFRDRDLLCAAIQFPGAGYWLTQDLSGGEGARALGQTLRCEVHASPHIVGPAEATQAFWDGVAGAGIGLRLRIPQLVLQRGRDARLPPPPLPLRLAQPSDLADLIDCSCLMQQEETGIAVTPLDVEGYRRGALAQIEAQRVWVLRHAAHGKLMFRAAIAPHAPQVAQIEGVFVPHAFRRSGIAQTCLTVLCDRLLRRHALVALCVAESNAPARALYDRLGFAEVGRYQTLHVAVRG